MFTTILVFVIAAACLFYALTHREKDAQGGYTYRQWSGAAAFAGLVLAIYGVFTLVLELLKALTR